MSKYKKICTICGKSYEYCNSCSRFANYPRWMTSYCSEECRAIFKAIMAFRSGRFSKEEAAKELNGINVGKITNIGIKKTADEILKAAKVSVEEPVKQHVQEQENNIEKKVEKAEEVVQETAPISDVEVKPEPKIVQNNEDEIHKSWKRRFSGYRKNNYKR